MNDRGSWMRRLAPKELLALAAFTLLLALIGLALLKERHAQGPSSSPAIDVRVDDDARVAGVASSERAPADVQRQAVIAEPPAVVRRQVLSKVPSTWGDRLNPTGDIPDESFKAFYFNSQQPNRVIASEVVADVVIDYSWSEFHDIRSEDFGGYWVGRFHFAEDASRVIDIRQSWSKTRVIIDRTLVYEGGSDARVPQLFSKGEHLIEVEFLNNWHTTGFSMSFREPS